MTFVHAHRDAQQHYLQQEVEDNNDDVHAADWQTPSYPGKGENWTKFMFSPYSRPRTRCDMTTSDPMLDDHQCQEYREGQIRGYGVNYNPRSFGWHTDAEMEEIPLTVPDDWENSDEAGTRGMGRPTKAEGQ